LRRAGANFLVDKAIQLLAQEEPGVYPLWRQIQMTNRTFETTMRRLEDILSDSKTSQPISAATASERASEPASEPASERASEPADFYHLDLTRSW
jgi:hypothetical protein